MENKEFIRRLLLLANRLGDYKVYRLKRLHTYDEFSGTYLKEHIGRIVARIQLGEKVAQQSIMLWVNELWEQTLGHHI